MKKILITGAGGWLGQYLATALADRYEVHAVNRQQLNLADADQVHRHFASNRYHSVINCAAAGRYTPAAEDWNIVSNNLAGILNLMTNRYCFHQLINIGTGAEFDISLPIDLVHESQIFQRSPKQSYGLSKNIIARYLSEQEQCYTLRLFGCFDPGEDSNRLLKKFHSVVAVGQEFNLADRPFDMISARDFATVVDAVILGKIDHTDINCVYAEKYRLSDILKLYCDTHGLDSNLVKITSQGLSYTGRGNRLSKYHLPLNGLIDSITHY